MRITRTTTQSVQKTKTRSALRRASLCLVSVGIILALLVPHSSAQTNPPHPRNWTTPSTPSWRKLRRTLPPAVIRSKTTKTLRLQAENSFRSTAPNATANVRKAAARPRVCSPNHCGRPLRVRSSGSSPTEWRAAECLCGPSCQNRNAGRLSAISNHSLPPESVHSDRGEYSQVVKYLHCAHRSSLESTAVSQVDAPKNA